MMYQKPLLASDTTSAEKIIAEKSPRKQKCLGRKVQGPDLEIYDRCKLDIVTKGNWLKFG